MVKRMTWILPEEKEASMAWSSNLLATHLISIPGTKYIETWHPRLGRYSRECGEM